MRVESLTGYTNLKVEEETITSTPGLALANDDGRHRCTICKVSESFGEAKQNLRTLLTKFRLALLHRRHDHVTDSGIRETIQMRATAIGFYDIERLCAAVVGAVEDGADGQTEGNPEFVTSSSCTCCRRK